MYRWYNKQNNWKGERMKNVIKILLFLAYTVSIFLVKHDMFAVIVLGINLLLTLALKISIKEEIGNILGVILFVIFTAAINIIVVDLKTGIRIGVKLILVCNITYIFSKITSYTELAEALEKIFSVFKFTKINPKNVSLMICIAIAFIPTISRQIKQVRDSLKSKGITINIKNWSLVFEPVTISLLKRVDEIESSLRAKAYQEM